MANRLFKRGDFSTLTPGIVKLFGYVEIGASGLISTTVPAKCDGFTITKTAAQLGRYTITLDDKYSRLLGVNVTLNGDDTAAYTTNTGAFTFVRSGSAITNGGSKVFYIQFAAIGPATATATYVDAEVESNVEIAIEITLKNKLASGGKL